MGDSSQEKATAAAPSKPAAAAARANWRATPTQEENDMAALGVPVDRKQDDGSGPDPHSAPERYSTRDMRPEKPSGGYTTR
jgi:hypothetical protein